MNQSAFNVASMELYNQIAAAIELPISLAGTVGNILVVMAHVKDPLKLFQSSSSPFILNIAVLDLIMSFMSLVSSLLMLIFIPNLKAESSITAFILFTLMNMSYPSFLCLSIDRFCSVAFPLWHRVRFTKTVCRCWLCAIWLLHLLFSTFILTLLPTEKEVYKLVYTSSCFLCTQGFYLGAYISLKKTKKENAY